MDHDKQIIDIREDGETQLKIGPLYSTFWNTPSLRDPSQPGERPERAELSGNEPAGRVNRSLIPR